jgi:hypothetical protein
MINGPQLSFARPVTPKTVHSTGRAASMWHPADKHDVLLQTAHIITVPITFML